MKKKRQYHVGMWLFLLLQVLFVVWIISAIAQGAGAPTDCHGLDTKSCNDAESAGTAIGVGLVVALWVAVDVITGMVWLVVHFARRGRQQ